MSSDYTKKLRGIVETDMQCFATAQQLQMGEDVLRMWFDWIRDQLHRENWMKLIPLALEVIPGAKARADIVSRASKSEIVKMIMDAIYPVAKARAEAEAAVLDPDGPDFDVDALPRCQGRHHSVATLGTTLGLCRICGGSTWPQSDG